MQFQVTKPELEKFVDELVKSGQFASATEVVEAGLARLMLDPAPEDLDEETCAAIDQAEGEFDGGEDRSFKEFAAEFRAKYLGK
ncbi:MAG: Bacterial antitoxin of ParD toxin-antitoxin type system [Phycisphaerales bacterium]|nr:Bacterial antitoxin of ParD toxin-antitoxin type system [Phycisphaerales bacterium]